MGEYFTPISSITGIARIIDFTAQMVKQTLSACNAGAALAILKYERDPN